MFNWIRLLISKDTDHSYRQTEIDYFNKLRLIISNWENFIQKMVC